MWLQEGCVGRFIYWILVVSFCALLSMDLVVQILCWFTVCETQGDVSLPLLVSCSVPSTPELICSKKNKTSFGEQHSPRRVAV